MNLAMILSAVVLVAAPASILAAPTPTVRAGIEAWQQGDHAAAIAAWTPLAARGDADAAFNLGQAYRLGKGVPTDLGRAQTLLEQAARRGHVDAATTLGLLLFHNGNRSAAIRWLRTAAEAGEARAMLLYGTALYNGDGIAPDRVAAYAFVSRSAAQGLGAARATLGELDLAIPLDQRRKGLALAQTMVVAKQSPAPAPRPAATPIAIKARSPSLPAARPGDWRIQLGAFGQRATAEALFTRLRARLGARQAYYVPAGAVVRLQVGPFETRAAATAACAALPAQACFPLAAR